jgi:hypothetical protein
MEYLVPFIGCAEQKYRSRPVNIKYPASFLKIQNGVEYCGIAQAESIDRIGRLLLYPAMIVWAVPILKVVNKDIPFPIKGVFPGRYLKRLT